LSIPVHGLRITAATTTTGTISLRQLIILVSLAPTAVWMLLIVYLLLLQLCLLPFMMLFHSSCGANSIIQRSVLHALDNGFTAGIYFFWVVRSKGSRNGRSIIHPTLQFELSYHFVSVGFGTTLRDLVSSHIWFVQIVYKIDSQFDQKIPLGLRMIRIVEPIVKVGLVSEPQHGVTAILNPKGLLPFFHDNSSEGNS